jgi:uncharacterized membrane protein YgdD (TMEM256/DUF423 family)
MKAAQKSKLLSIADEELAEHSAKLLRWGVGFLIILMAIVLASTRYPNMQIDVVSLGVTLGVFCGTLYKASFSLFRVIGAIGVKHKLSK